MGKCGATGAVAVDQQYGSFPVIRLTTRPLFAISRQANCRASGYFRLVVRGSKPEMFDQRWTDTGQLARQSLGCDAGRFIGFAEAPQMHRRDKAYHVQRERKQLEHPCHAVSRLCYFE